MGQGKQYGREYKEEALNSKRKKAVRTQAKNWGYPTIRCMGG